MNGAQNSQPESQEVFEKINIRPVLYYSAVISLILFVCSFKIIYNGNIVLLPSFPFFTSYIFSYLVAFVLVFTCTALVYRHRAFNSMKFQEVKFLGLYPIELVNRTGVKYIDFAGVIAGIILCVCCLIIPGLGQYFPGFLFFTLSFLFAIISGSSLKWKLRRRERYNG